MRRTLARVGLLAILSISTGSWVAFAQTVESIPELRRRAAQLIEAEQYTEALSLLERSLAVEPNHADDNFRLGFALTAIARATADASERAALRVRARTALLKARELGIRTPMLDALVESIPADGSDRAPLSRVPQADGQMIEGEAHFAAKRMDDALASYQQALELDPSLYEAALFSGDAYLQKNDYAQAERWYQKAIAINPARETAYRYSATPLMRQGRIAEARDRYIEAYITEPYSRAAVAGLSQWAQQTKTRVAHPEIVVPTAVTFAPDGTADVKIDPQALLKDDGSSAWVVYGGTRVAWRKVRFAEMFPAETTYRHTLAEEADALRAVAGVAASLAAGKPLDPTIALLKRLDEANLLEAFVLLARPDEEIARDHPGYLKQHRDRLRQYVVTYVVQPGTPPLK